MDLVSIYLVYRLNHDGVRVVESVWSTMAKANAREQVLKAKGDTTDIDLQYLDDPD
jgi:hypothetical protein